MNYIVARLYSNCGVFFFAFFFFSSFLFSLFLPCYFILSPGKLHDAMGRKHKVSSKE